MTTPTHTRQMRFSAGYRAHQFVVRARRTAFTRLVRGGFASFGSGSSLSPPAGIDAAPHVSVGAGVVLGPQCRLLLPTKAVSGEIRIALHDHVSIAGSCTISAATSVVVEEGALLARGVYIADHNHAYVDPDRWVKDQGIDTVAPVRIGRGAWLGENVVVCPGVIVGQGAVIAAHAVVRSHIPPFSLAVGAPARVVKSWARP